jgi:hypothetical protein
MSPLLVCVLQTPPVTGAAWLQEDHLMGGKMKDWDKAVFSSEDEEEDE